MRFTPKNLDKLYFPGAGVTKGDVLSYYERISSVMMPHLRDRPIVMRRFPDGITEEGFYHKEVPDYFPQWVERVPVEKKTEKEMENLVVCNIKDTLPYLADQGCISIHPWLSTKDNLDIPNQIVFDLDPPGDNFELVKRAAFAIKDYLAGLDVTCYVKTTGSKGLHVLVPIEPKENFDAVRTIAKSIAEHLASKHAFLTVEHRKNKRKKRLFVDYLRNAYGQTAVAPYSLRALPDAPVATPIYWDEVKDLSSSSAYSITNIFRKLGQKEDPWRSLERQKSSRLKPST